MFSDDEFLSLRDIIYKKCGLFFTERNRQSLEIKVSQRIEHTNLSNLGHYMRYLASKESGQEWQSLLDSVTVNETFFFRDVNQISAIGKNIIPELLDLNSVQKKVRIWSAAASSCDEAYSVAILFAEHLGHAISQWDIKIFATDLNENVLSFGKRGVYDAYSLRNTPDEIKRKYFTITSDDHFRVNDTVRMLVVTDICNLIDYEKSRQFNSMDLILLRNILIYFDDNSRKTVINMCSDNLKKGGYLFLGTAETLPKSDIFKTVFFVNAYGYKKIPDKGEIYNDAAFAFEYKKLIEAKKTFAGVEKRKARRVPCDMQARCFVIKDNVESEQEARVKNISPFGCMLVVHVPVSVGTNIRIKIGDKHRTAGIVRWKNAKKDECLIGVEFR
jgi:chemotaxis protein methyltransferase CheR